MGAVYGGYDLATDIGSLTIGGGPAAIARTGINKSAIERIGGHIDGHIDLGAFFDDTAGQMHPVASALPTTDRQMMVYLGSAIGGSAACMIGKQLDYAATRSTDGALDFAIPHPANGYGLEWCSLLTAGQRTETTATNGASLDNGASSTTGWAAYLQVLNVAGTSVTLTIQDSANDSAFAGFTGSAFTAVVPTRGVQRLQGAAGATVRRYLRVVSSGTFSTATFMVAFTRTPIGS